MAKAKHSASVQRPAAPIVPVDDLAQRLRLADWELAGLMRAAGWATGKQVSEDEFLATLQRFRQRPQGSGRI